MQKKIVQIKLRLSESDLETIKRLAVAFCEGNVSQWIRLASTRFQPGMTQKALITKRLKNRGQKHDLE